MFLSFKDIFFHQRHSVKKFAFFILWGHQTHQPVIGLAHRSQPLKILLGLCFPIKKGWDILSIFLLFSHSSSVKWCLVLYYNTHAEVCTVRKNWGCFLKFIKVSQYHFLNTGLNIDAFFDTIWIVKLSWSELGANMSG